jgi:hypothetical protein
MSLGKIESQAIIMLLEAKHFGLGIAVCLARLHENNLTGRIHVPDESMRATAFFSTYMLNYKIKRHSPHGPHRTLTRSAAK